MVEYLNLLLGNSAESEKYWKGEMTESIKMSFFYHHQDINTVNLPSSIDSLVDKLKLAQELVQRTGTMDTSSIYSQISQ